MRKKLQAGVGRKLASVVVTVVAFTLMYRFWPTLLARQINPLDAAQKIAFVAAAFSVTAYNLRTRVIDLILKIDAEPSKIAQLSTIARDCGRKLTNLVLLFSVTALVMGGGGYVPREHATAVYYASAVTALFGVSLVQFVYVLFAFERLERYMLDDAEAKAAAREANRLLR